MADYEREWTTRLDDSDRDTRLRFGLTTNHGSPEQFLVQLEYKDGGEWHPVARFDHESDGPQYRDVAISGLHLDVQAPDGTQKRKVTGFPPIDPQSAVPAAEQYLKQHYESLVTEFEACL